MKARARPFCVALGLVLLGGSAVAGDRGEAERVRAAVLAGEVLPLPQLLERLQRSHPGQVLEIELERGDGRWIYEIKLLQAGGRLLKLEVEAKSGAVLKQRVRSAPASAPH
ncbi:PepSY domain-containing protein [Inhella proteolytica]|uniref:PepSY domain-containing protein n=1 Tax=Inhella proteolytica TaxID=2795029 RepID=A0A931J3W1_9BURK|nr:PepSY domain-containing protein [Inhella proteolytica]MBH9579126.1 PepSY domain-containing protein [Inhella proteolytica]